MHEANPLESLIFFLLAAVIAVPLFRRLNFGAILGYLFAGILIGPQVFHLIEDPESILHFSEIGVVLLLFIIGFWNSYFKDSVLVFSFNFFSIKHVVMILAIVTIFSGFLASQIRSN